jgi:hypothetical protein
MEAYIAFQKGSCGSPYNWVEIASNQNPSTQTYEWDVSNFQSGLYCIAVNIDQLSGPDAGATTGLFYLDLDNPILTISAGSPKVIDGENTYVNQQTPITLSCTDDGTYDSGVDYIEYTINDGTTVKVNADTTTFTFSEDSQHVLNAKCVDKVGKEDSKTKTFIVDSVSPVLDRTVGEPKIATEGGYFVTQNTEICVSAMNGESEPHPVPGAITISCEGVNLDENNCFHYAEDSQHTLNCNAQDALGNSGSQTWNDVVESQAPITALNYEGPYYTDQVSEWIDGVSKVVLSSSDPAPHPSGVDKTFYRYYIVDDSFCLKTAEGKPTAPTDLGWTLYEAPFSMDESCHAIEFYSVDKLGNEETAKTNFVFVDKTAPLTNKVVGKPSHKCTTGDSKCQTGWDWIVTTDTKIELSCTDQLPHPSGAAQLCYRITLDGDPQEWVCENTDKATVQFNEDSEHLLEFYCVDHVNKTSSTDSELFKVDGKQVEIPLYKKWNLISIPFNLISNDISEVFNQTGDKVEIVWSYDNGTWHVYSPNGPSDLETIEPGLGYWVKAKEDTKLVVGGSLLGPAPGVPPSVSLEKGWNLIGHYGTTDKSVYCSLFSLIDTNVGFPRWSALNGYDNVNKHFTSLNAMNPSDMTEPGKGYWIEMDVKDLYSPATTCWGFPQAQ